MIQKIAGSLIVAIAAMLIYPGCASADGKYREPQIDSAFWDFWGDGKAELAAYDLTFSRYGETREGVAVTIFVTETFSNRKRVKSDPGKNPASDEFPVMKLNLIQDFPTGIYDYNLMTSVFVALQPVNGRLNGTPAKVSYSSQEWCGQVYQQVLFDANKMRINAHSYFDGEADSESTEKYPANGFTEDALLHWARGLAAPIVAPGESVEAQFFDSLEFSRLRHQAPAWRKATLQRSATTENLSTPAGDFEAQLAEVKIEGGRHWKFYVEKNPPQRIIKWEADDGRSATLLGSKRLEYWRMNKGEFDDAVRELGLTPRGKQMP